MVLVHMIPAHHEPETQPPATPASDRQPSPSENIETGTLPDAPPAPVVVQQHGGASTGIDSGPGSSTVGDAWLWIAILIGVAIVAGAALMAYRRRVLAASESESPETFMETMRRMRASGEMSEEEFQAVRRKLIGAMKDRAPRPAPRDGEGR